MQFLKFTSILIFACSLIQINGEDMDNNQKGRLPTVFIVGAAKGGTSSLFELMIEHPLLCGGEKKETQFFNSNNKYLKEIDYYKKWFRNPKCDNILAARFIDGTPIIHNSRVWDRIDSFYNMHGSKSMRDNLKFIVLLREPVSRDVSWYKMTVRMDAKLGSNFSEIKTMKESILGNYDVHSINKNDLDDVEFGSKDGIAGGKRGMYHKQLQAFCKVFRRDQIFILSSQEIVLNTGEAMERILKFIGIQSDESFQSKSTILPHDNHLDKNLFHNLSMDCITDHVPALDCAVRDKAGKY
jgi:hypothetical protein